MCSSITGSRSRRAAALRLFFAYAVTCHAGITVAQQVEAVDPNASGGFIATDDNTTTNPSGLIYGPCADPGSCPASGLCDSCELCEPYCNQRCCAGWIGVEWLHWRLDGNRLPPLVTDGPVKAANPGRLNDPNTRILSGGEQVNDDWRDGARIYGGLWLDCCHCWGIGADYFDAGQDNYDFTSDPDTTRIVGRPFFNSQLGIDDLEFVSVPNELFGTARVKSNDEFRGGGVTVNHCIWQCCDPCCENHGAELILLSGYRNYDYDTNLSITENLTVLPGTTTPLVPGTTFFVRDSFHTHNEFNGGEIGVQGVGKHCWWWLDGMAKVAMGEQNRTVIVNGQTTTVVLGNSATAAGGLLTSELTNIGHYHDSDFVFIPEFRSGAGAMITRCWSVRAGYNVIIWGDVARAASHLPPGLAVDPRNLPFQPGGGGPEPEFPGIRGSQLVAHGLDFSITWQF